jgi:2-dehydropantoate 2-reductase
MRIAVFGAGGVGGYFGGRLAQAGEDVVFIARGEHLRAIQTQGLRVDSIKGDFIVRPAQASDDPGQVGEVDVVLVAVKTWQVPEAAQSMRPVMGSNTYVLPLENGVEAPSQLAAALGIERVLGGMCQISSAIAGPGHIRHVGIDPFIAFGELDGRPSERVERLLRAFQRAEGMRVEAPDDIQAAMWRKFLFIAAISGVGAVARAPAGVIRSLPETRRLLELAMWEVYAIARARGIRQPEDVVAQTLAFIDGMGPSVIASMHRDILNGRPSELEAQNGAVVRLGLEAGVPTPVHDYLYASLLPQELKARGKIEF